jgi:hypothetical protein
MSTKNRYTKPTESTTELTEVIGEDGMVDMTLNNTEPEIITDDVDTKEPEVGITGDNTDGEQSENTDLDTVVPEVIITPEIKEPEQTIVPEVIKEPEPVVITKTSNNDISVINDSSVSIEDKIKWCLTEAPTYIKSLANQLTSYNETMKPAAIYDEQKMLMKQYELVSIYRSIFNVIEYKDFKVRFDVLNLFFAYYKDEAFAAQRLARFDYIWKWSSVELTTLLHVSEVVSQLCLYSERTKRLKQLNLDMALDSTTTIVTEEARNNIIRYYKI